MLDARDRKLRRRVALGRAGEAIAARHLETSGFTILERNVVAGGVELDIVAREAGCIVFVEVRARATSRFGDPALSVDGAKQRRLARGAHAWLRLKGAAGWRARFDVVGVVWEAGRPRISHYRDAFSSPF